MLRKFDGFNLYTDNTSLSAGWSSVAASAVIDTGRRALNNACKVYSAGAGLAAQKILDSQATWIVGAAFYTDSVVGANPLIKFSTSGGEQISLRVDASGFLYVSRNGSTLWSTTDPVYQLAATVWKYIEFKATINGSTGSWSLRINGSGSTLVSQSSVNTAGQGGTTADRVEVHKPFGTNTDFRFTDLYILDGQATDGRNDFLGDCRIDPLLPSGSDGAEDAQFSVTGDANAYGAIDDFSDSDTSYISSNTVGHKQTVNIDNMPYTPTYVHGVAVASVSRKDDSGGRDIKHLLRANSTNYQGSNTHALSTSYGVYRDEWSLNPADNQLFEKADVDALEIGVQVTA